MTAAAILDIDGTLVDSNYQHTIAWYRAFSEHGVTPPIWRLHRAIGMGGDQLVAAVAGEQVERQCGEAIRDAEGKRYAELIDEVRPFEGAQELIEELCRRDHPVVLASSAKRDEVERYVDMVGARELAATWTSADDVEQTKPEPDLVSVAAERAEAESAVMVGDSTWDVEAARRAGVETLAVLTGGFSDAELRERGASEVFESIAELCEALGRTPLR